MLHKWHFVVQGLLPNGASAVCATPHPACRFGLKQTILQKELDPRYCTATKDLPFKENHVRLLTVSFSYLYGLHQVLYRTKVHESLPLISGEIIVHVDDVNIASFMPHFDCAHNRNPQHSVGHLITFALESPRLEANKSLLMGSPASPKIPRDFGLYLNLLVTSFEVFGTTPKKPKYY